MYIGRRMGAIQWYPFNIPPNQSIKNAREQPERKKTKSEVSIEFPIQLKCASGTST